MRHIAIATLLLVGGCATKEGPGEIFQMTETCFKHKQSIQIEFVPHPVSAETLDDVKEVK